MNCSMAKQMNTTQIENELKSGSAFFKEAGKLQKQNEDRADGKPEVEKENDTSDTNERTDKPNGRNERSESQHEGADQTVIDEVVEGRVEDNSRPTKRHSFEAYVDQIEAIEDMQYQFKKRTGKKLSSSRLIREALDSYLNRLKEIIRDEEEQPIP